MTRRKGFTLIELLIVIAIIVMLTSIVMPTLGAVRGRAAQAVCHGNLRVLSTAWLTYAEDNRGLIIGGNTGVNPDDWVKRPILTIGPSIKDQQEAIRQGKLYPYVKNINAYHCPGDRERIGTDGTRYEAWGSYSIAGGLNGEGWPGCYGQIKKISAIQSPETKYVFVAEADRRGWNIGSWGVHVSTCTHGMEDYFGDRLAAWHLDNKCNFGWVDGHTSTKTWQHDRTIGFINGELGNSNVVAFVPPDTDNPDLRFMQRGFPYVPK